MVFVARDFRRMSAIVATIVTTIVTTSGSAARPGLSGRVLLTRHTHFNAGLITVRQADGRISCSVGVQGKARLAVNGGRPL
jgi:hypothetical protein